MHPYLADIDGQNVILLDAIVSGALNSTSPTSLGLFRNIRSPVTYLRNFANILLANYFTALILDLIVFYLYRLSSLLKIVTSTLRNFLPTGLIMLCIDL